MAPTQADIDFKPIKSRFPSSTMSNEGVPCILSSLKDPDGIISGLEGAALGLQFDIEDEFRVVIDAYHIPVVTLSLDQLERIRTRALVAKKLFDEWKNTPTGKAWLSKQRS